MILYYMKHAWRMLWQDKFFTIISLLGIGLAVSFIMVILTVNEIDDASIAPEVNRYRTLYVKGVRECRGEHNKNNSYLSQRLLDNVFYNLKDVESVTGVMTSNSVVEPSLFSGEGQNISVKWVDGNYWKFYEFEFVAGKPFTSSDFKSGIRVAVIDEHLAQTLYKGESCLGKDVYIAQQPFKIVGVVKSVDPSATFAYSRIWAPYTTNDQIASSKESLACGGLNALILAKSPSDFDAIKEQITKNLKAYVKPVEKEIRIELHGPDNHSEQRFRKWASDEVSRYDEMVKLWLTVIIVLMVVPALNMASFTVSRMKKRQEELGLRRSFGAFKSNIIAQVVAENMVLTLIGGVIGLIFSIFLLFAFQSTLYPDGLDFNITTFFRPTILGYLIATGVVINLLSALFPAIYSARQPIVQALKSKKS
ncbi:ABC transporter permease [Alistipes sp. ZOR0009]|uniref:ABC transporter permease n=1 Tax=Alistipes sp. ZOR0009 TaxID=1339253 RepID=UPI0009DE395C|nr:ABC transporter permease [Alistipes sp. ZOR0009]